MQSKARSIILFNQQRIRRHWDGKKELWYFAVVDVIAALTESNNQQVYWRVLKKRLIDEGSNETVTKCNALKMLAPDGKMRLTDVADTQTMLRLIQSIPSPNAEFAVATFYNYLKVRKLEKAFEILSNNYKEGHNFDYWKQGYEPLLDTTVIKIEEDKDKKDRIYIKLSTKDMVDDEIVYKYFEGYWDVKNIDGRWRLWEAKIKKVKDPYFFWFYE